MHTWDQTTKESIILLFMTVMLIPASILRMPYQATQNINMQTESRYLFSNLGIQSMLFVIAPLLLYRNDYRQPLLLYWRKEVEFLKKNPLKNIYKRSRMQILSKEAIITCFLTIIEKISQVLHPVSNKKSLKNIIIETTHYSNNSSINNIIRRFSDTNKQIQLCTIMTDIQF